ncbi:MAG: diadenylate cyclase CdaA [Sandaracinaceae bacterium]
MSGLLAGLRVDALHAFFLGRPYLEVAIDVADILIVAFLFYRVLLLLRGTRAMQMVIGLVMVFVVYQASRNFGLVTLFSILDRLLTYAVLIVVVLFQNEIRRALTRVGSRPFLRGPSRAREAHVVEEVVKAATALAQKRIGALIAFERGAALEEFVEPGTRLDAEVSRELLYSIFVPSYENPMHDGAVVLRDGRVSEAGVFFPLTESNQLQRSFGTRHRAAIGITEETDAVVVVVSEERGAISVCFAGNIVADLDASSLRQALVGLLAKGSPSLEPAPAAESEPRALTGPAEPALAGAEAKEPAS